MKDENDTQTKELDLHTLETALQKFVKDEVKKAFDLFNKSSRAEFFEEGLNLVFDVDALKRLLEENQYSEFVTVDSFIDELQNNDIPTRDEVVDPDQIDETVERAIENYFDVNQFVLKKGGK